MPSAVNYLNPDVPSVLPWYKPQTMIATNDNLKGYGCLVSKEEYKNFLLK